MKPSKKPKLRKRIVLNAENVQLARTAVKMYGTKRFNQWLRTGPGSSPHLINFIAKVVKGTRADKLYHLEQELKKAEALIFALDASGDLAIETIHRRHAIIDEIEKIKRNRKAEVVYTRG